MTNLEGRVILRQQAIGADRRSRRSGGVTVAFSTDPEEVFASRRGVVRWSC